MSETLEAFNAARDNFIALAQKAEGTIIYDREKLEESLSVVYAARQAIRDAHEYQWTEVVEDMVDISEHTQKLGLKPPRLG